MLTVPPPLSEAECIALEQLRLHAIENPVNLRELTASYGDDFAVRHKTWLLENRIILPSGPEVIYCLELGQPCGTCRHLAVAMPAPDDLPKPEMVWQVAEVLGFAGSLQTCICWLEEPLVGEISGKVLNVIQPLTVAESATAEIVLH